MPDNRVGNIYLKCFGFDAPREFQETVYRYFLDERFPMLLKAPTGSGKTEAVLAPFFYQFLANDFFIAPRLIYVLPMKVLVNSVAERIRSYAARISPYIDVKIQHGESPNAPFFLGDIIVTTLDQFLYAFARSSRQVQRHVDIPAGSIASSIVVFDEAHMYRDEMTFSMLRAILEILQFSSVPFVLMTATMPCSLERSLFENGDVFPEVTRVTGNISLGNELRVRIADNPLVEEGNVNITDEIIRMVKGRKALIVLNQVERSVAVYSELKERLALRETDIVLLHSRFTREDRQIHESRALSLYQGKTGPGGEGLDESRVVVSTQVLEAGIDFSAELLFTELAPADALIQRAGRCARYRGEKGEMIIFPVESNRGHLPYQEKHMEITRKWLENNPGLNMKDFDEVCSFVDILDYKASDFEASDSLFDLYECTLYADTRPQNIQLRKGKPVTLVVVDSSKAKARKMEDKIKAVVEESDIFQKAIRLDYRVGWGLFKKGVITHEMNFDPESGKWEPRKAREIVPFKTYVMDAKFYDPEHGVKKNVSTFVL